MKESIKKALTAFLMSIDYFVYLWRQWVAALQPRYTLGRQPFADMMYIM